MARLLINGNQPVGEGALAVSEHRDPGRLPIAYGGPDQDDLCRLARFGTVTVHASRFADRAEFFQRIETADVVINVRAYSVFDDEALAMRRGSS